VTKLAMDTKVRNWQIFRLRGLWASLENVVQDKRMLTELEPLFDKLLNDLGADSIGEHYKKQLEERDRILNQN
jgi:hypothetical protein